MKDITYNFPETIFASQNTAEQQLDHVHSEIDEATADFIYDRPREATMECIDVIHSAETLLRLLVNKHGKEKVLKAMEVIRKKNETRGYYEVIEST